MSNDYELLRNPTALLVLRVWIEQGSSLPLRAYSRRTTNVANGFEETSVDTDVESAVLSVRTWLEALLEADANGGEPPLNGHTNT